MTVELCAHPVIRPGERVHCNAPLLLQHRVKNHNCKQIACEEDQKADPLLRSTGTGHATAVINLGTQRTTSFRVTCVRCDWPSFSKASRIRPWGAEPETSKVALVTIRWLLEVAKGYNRTSKSSSAVEMGETSGKMTCTELHR